MAYTVGLDYGTNSVRALLVDIADGRELASFVYEYPTGKNGIILDESDHNLARQNPADYLNGIEATIKGVLGKAKADKDFRAGDVIAIGVDTTGSTPLPVDKTGNALVMSDEFKDNPNAMAWLWKDHTSFAEATEITELARKEKPEYLAKCGGVYSSEWFFSKLLHCLRIDEKVFEAAYSWVECCDFITGNLTGTQAPDVVKRSRCAAGHKAMYNKDWGGLPAKEFLSKFDSRLGDLRDRLYDQTYAVDTSAGKLTAGWAKKLGLQEGIDVAVGAFDAHLGAVGSGIGAGKLVKILGTSSCDMLVSEPGQSVPDIEGICGIVDGSILPGCFGLEAGQSAVGDIFNWFVNYIEPGGKQAGSHQALTEKANKLRPGQSGLLALDWNNGNRTILVDQRLTGLLLGQTLHTKPEEIYRTLIEATAFGALTIINRFEEYSVKVNEVINCGGISEKNALVMQIYADVCNREMKISSSAQTCALGSCIAAAVVAGGHSSFADAQKAMCSVKETTFKPISANVSVYKKLYKLYTQLHDAFGKVDYNQSLHNVMKDLLEIKDNTNC